MSTTITIDEDDSFVGAAIEVMALIGGWAAGGIAGYHVAKALPAATTITQKGVNWFVTGTSTLVTEHYVAKAISEEGQEVRKAALLAKVLADRKRQEKAEKKEKTEKKEQ